MFFLYYIGFPAALQAHIVAQEILRITLAMSKNLCYDYHMIDSERVLLWKLTFLSSAA